jgi:hypothetical protein
VQERSREHGSVVRPPTMAAQAVNMTHIIHARVGVRPPNNPRTDTRTNTRTSGGQTFNAITHSQQQGHGSIHEPTVNIPVNNPVNNSHGYSIIHANTRTSGGQTFGTSLGNHSLPRTTTPRHNPWPLHTHGMGAIRGRTTCTIPLTIHGYYTGVGGG